MDEEKVARFSRLFRGNDRTRGVYHPEEGRAETWHVSPESEDYRKHLDGELGLGIVPIQDDGNAWFGAIDIDVEGDLDITALEAQVQHADMPLIVCRSKSKGAHLYLFGSEPLPAKQIRRTLAKWAEKLGFAGSEIFPKQAELAHESDGTTQRGNWINLPWFGGDDTVRYTVEGGKAIRFEYFLELAESRRVSAAELVERGSDEHDEAPPCIQSIISQGVGHGERNEAMYNLTIYAKQAYPETYQSKLFDLNARIFPSPLAYDEAQRTIKSAARREYRYKCSEEPLRSRCRASVCVKRKFGITEDEKNQMQLGGHPEYTRLIRIESDPVRWVLYINGEPLTLATEDLMDHKRVRTCALERLMRMIPPMKNDQWQTMIQKLLTEVEVVQAPEEASAKGMIRRQLDDFVAKADLTSDGTDKEERENLLFGEPVVQLHEQTGQRFIYFRGSDFVDYLRKNRAEEAKHSNLWMMLREVGVEHTKIRVRGKSGPISVWCIALTEEHETNLPDQDTQPEM